MVDETGSGKPAMAGVRSSTEVRFGPDPRISIQARGRQPAALQRPDTRQHLTACPSRPKKTLASTEASTHGHDVVRSESDRIRTSQTSREPGCRDRVVFCAALSGRPGLFGPADAPDHGAVHVACRPCHHRTMSCKSGQAAAGGMSVRARPYSARKALRACATVRAVATAMDDGRGSDSREAALNHFEPL